MKINHRKETLLHHSVSRRCQALLSDRGCSAIPAGQARVSMIPISQNCNVRSMYTDVPIFLAQKNTNNITKRHGFYPLYADTVPLNVQVYIYIEALLTTIIIAITVVITLPLYMCIGRGKSI